MLIFFIIQAVFSPGVSSHQFLELGLGARAISMGGAYTAVSDDAYGLFWNPAGSMTSRKFESAFSFSTLFDDASLFSGAVKCGIPRIGVLSGGFAFFSTKDIVRDFSGIEGEEFSISDLAVAFSYAYQLKKQLILGLGAKGLYSQLYTYNAYSASMDGGILFTPLQWLYLGCSLRELGTGAKFYKKTDLPPTNLATGVAVKIPVLKLVDFVLSSDVKLSRNNSAEWSIGGEGKLMLPKDKKSKNNSISSVSGRLGYKPGTYFSGEWNGLSYGIGIDYPIKNTNIAIKLDLVYIDYGYFGQAEYISASLTF